MLSRKLEYQITGRDLSRPAFGSVQRSITATETRLKSFTNVVNRGNAALAAVSLSGLGGGVALRDLGRIETSFIRLSNVSKTYDSDLKFIEESAARLNVRVSSLLKSFTDISTLESIGLLDPGQARDLAVGFENAAKTFGTSSNDIQLGLRGIRQSLTQTVVRAQEWDQIFDALGTIQPAVARQLGLTAEEFQQYRGNGNLLAKDLVSALIPALKEFEGGAEKAGKSIEGAGRRIGRTYETILTSFRRPISGGFQAFAESFETVGLGIASNADLISDSIETIGTVAVAAFASRALGSMVNFAAAQRTALQVNQQYRDGLIESQAAVINNAQAQQQTIAIQARATAEKLNFARAALGSLNAQKAALQEELKTTSTLQNRTPIYKRLAAIEQERVAAFNAVTAANQANLAAQTRLNETLRTANGRISEMTARQRVYATVTRAATVAQRGFNAALGLFGGPAGIALTAAAALFVEYRNITSTVRNLEGAIKDVERATIAGNQRELLEIENARLAATQKIKDLRAEESIIIRDIQNNGNRVFGPGESDEISLARIRKEIENLDSLLDQLKVNTEFANSILGADQATKELTESVTTLEDRLKSIDKGDVIGKLFPKKARIEEIGKLRSNLDDLLAGQKIGIDVYKEGNAALDEQLNKITGVTQAREDAIKAQDRQLESLQTLRTGALDEIGRLQQEFNNNEAQILKLQVQLGDDFLSNEEVDRLIESYQKKLDKQVVDIEDRRLQKELENLNVAARERQRLFDEQIQRQRTNAEAAGVADPFEGLALNYQTDLDLLNNQLRKKEILDSDYRIRKQALDVKYANETNDIISNLPVRQQSLGQFFGSDSGLDFAQDQTRNFLSLLEKDVGSYIDIQSHWTDAEKARANRSNQINKRAFENNKKLQISNAIVDGLRATQTAFSSAPWPFNYVAAGIAAATAAKQVSAIKGTNFGSSGTVSFGGGSVSAGSASETSQTVQDNNRQDAGATVLMFTQIPSNLEGAVNNEWLYENQQRNLADMIKRGIVSSDAKVEVADTYTPGLLNRRGRAARRAY